MFSYKWDEKEYRYRLYTINSLGEQTELDVYIRDREDLLIYLEENYNAVILIVKGGLDK